MNPALGLIDHGAPERQAIIDSAEMPDSQRLLAQLAFERARADMLETACREAHLACCRGDLRHACNILVGALRV